MTQAQAATVAAAIIDAGYVPRITATGASWTIVVSAPNGEPIPASTIADFAVQQGVTGQAHEAEFV